MGIYIQGMEMPKDREINLRIDEKGEVYVYGSYPTELYKAVPVQPHGRLIDADVLAAKCDSPHWCVWLSDIDAAPTVVPAEEAAE